MHMVDARLGFERAMVGTSVKWLKAFLDIGIPNAQFHVKIGTPMPSCIYVNIDIRMPIFTVCMDIPLWKQASHANSDILPMLTECKYSYVKMGIPHSEILPTSI